MLILITAAFFVSLLVNMLIILASKRIKAIITDNLHVGPQVFHKNPTPRIGGVGIFIAIVSTLPIVFLKDKDLFNIFSLITLVATFVFLAGFIEDITKRLSPKVRLGIIAFSSLVMIQFIGIYISKIDFEYVDYLFKYPLFSIIFTVFAITGLTNAFNIIDGFNGLASMIAMMNLMAISYVAYKNLDFTVMYICLIIVFAILGFFLLNYPYGLIFLGDGGAYLIGFLVGVLSVMLVERNKEVSPWFALLVNSYPFVETMFSMYRKKFLRGISPTMPDGIHLHMIIYKIYSKKFFKSKKSNLRNPFTSLVLWLINLVALIPSIIFYKSKYMLILSLLIFAAIYVSIYLRLINKKIPSWAYTK